MSEPLEPVSNDVLRESLEQILAAPMSAAMERLRLSAPSGGVASLGELLMHEQPPQALVIELVDVSAEKSARSIDLPASVVEALHVMAIAAGVTHRRIGVRDAAPIREAFQRTLGLSWLPEQARQILTDGVQFLSQEPMHSANQPAMPTMKAALDEILLQKDAPKRPATPKREMPSWWRSEVARRLVAVGMLVLGSIPLACNLMPSHQVDPEFEGFHDAARGALITGWAWDRSRPNEPIDVTIEDGTNGIVTVTADQERPDTTDKGNGRHGFAYEVPKAQRDGRTHTVWVKIAGTRRLLDDTPRQHVYYR